MPKDISSVIAGAESYLHDEGYGTDSISRRQFIWHKLEEYARSRGETCLSQGLIDCFVASERYAGDLTDQSAYRYELYTRQLLQFSEIGSMEKKSLKGEFVVPDEFQGAFQAYLAKLESRNLADTTMHRTALYAAQFLTHVSDRVEDLSALGASDVESYISTLEHLSQSTRNMVKNTLQQLIRVLVQSFGTDPSLEEAPCLKRAACRPALQSFYTPDEVERVLEASYSGNYPRRNRLVVALCVQYGLRIGDVRTLRLSDFHWHDDSIRIVQSKTGAPLTLPITEEIKLCIADYLRNERPETDSPYLFVKMTVPDRGKGPVSCLKGIVRRAFERSGVDIRGRRMGSHALRHSFATTLMNESTPYSEISFVLGHKSGNVTKKYLGIDIENLRKCALEVSVYAS